MKICVFSANLRVIFGDQCTRRFDTRDFAGKRLRSDLEPRQRQRQGGVVRASEKDTAERCRHRR